MTRTKKDKKQIPAADGVFLWPSETPGLIAGHCKTCGSYSFPRLFPFHKPDCEGEVEEVILKRTGKLQSFTVQHFPPPPPFAYNEPFKPYAVGLIALPEGISVPGILTGVDIDKIKIGMTAELVIEKMYDDKDGNEIMTWKFALRNA